MRKRYGNLLAIMVVGIVGALAWVAWPSREPVYQGKSLSVWLTGFSYGGTSKYGVDERGVAQALKHMGTNVIPALLAAC